MTRTHPSVVVTITVGAVGAHGHRDAERPRLAHRIAQGPHHVQGAQLQCHCIGVVTTRITERTHDGERGHKESALLAHQDQRLLIDVGAMLDAAYARSHRRIRAIAIVRMGCNEATAPRCLEHRRAQLLVRQFLPPRIGARQSRTLARPDLDDVRTARDHRAHHLRHLLGALQRRRKVATKLRKTQDEGLAQLRPHVSARHQHLRSGDISVTHEITRRESLQERITQNASGRNSGVQRSTRRGRILDVRVRVDEPGQHIGAAQIERTGAALRRRNLRDAAIRDAQIDLAHRGAGQAVVEMGVAQPLIGRSRGRCKACNGEPLQQRFTHCGVAMPHGAAVTFDHAG